MPFNQHKNTSHLIQSIHALAVLEARKPLQCKITMPCVYMHEERDNPSAITNRLQPVTASFSYMDHCMLTIHKNPASKKFQNLKIISKKESHLDALWLINLIS
jgi:hypothetical protein